MTRTLTACLAALTLVGGCKVVRTAPEVDATADAGTDPIAAFVAETYDAQLLPLVEAEAVEAGVLLAALDGGLEAAGTAHGIQATGGGAWTFLVKGEGVVVEADRESRAATLGVDVTGDGASDLRVQLGPVVRGTALRDAAPFYEFTDFRDQMEFAALARALNERATAALTLPEGDLVGTRASFAGATALRAADEALLLAPTRLALEPR